MEGLEGVPIGPAVEAGRRDSLTRYNAAFYILYFAAKAKRLLQSLTKCLQEQSPTKKRCWDLAQHPGGQITEKLLEMFEDQTICLFTHVPCLLTAKNLFMKCS